MGAAYNIYRPESKGVQIFDVFFAYFIFINLFSTKLDSCRVHFVVGKKVAKMFFLHAFLLFVLFFSSSLQVSSTSYRKGLFYFIFSPFIVAAIIFATSYFLQLEFLIQIFGRFVQCFVVFIQISTKSHFVVFCLFRKNFSFSFIQFMSWIHVFCNCEGEKKDT